MRRAEYVGFLHRHPFATEAYELGFAVGVREDYSFQTGGVPNVDLPVSILDNDFRDPDLDRYVECFRELEPSVGILGDAYSYDEAEELNEVYAELSGEFPRRRFVAVPKSGPALEVLDEGLVLGYAMGYSDVLAEDFSEIGDWRGRRVHLLGASPPKQYSKIEELTQPTLSGDPPADIVGLDWNGVHKGALVGEYWSRDGWQAADHLSIRETVRESLQEMKRFWREKDVWPETTPRELYGPASLEPDDSVYAVSGETIRTREELESAFVEEYEDDVYGFESEVAKEFFEYREGLK